MKKKTNNIKLFFTLALSLSLSLSLSLFRFHQMMMKRISRMIFLWSRSLDWAAVCF